MFADVLTANFIIASDYTHGRITQVNLQTGNVVKLPLSINKPSGIAFDKSTRMLFFSDSSKNTIMTTSLHGTNKTLFYTTGLYEVLKLNVVVVCTIMFPKIALFCLPLP